MSNGTMIDRQGANNPEVLRCALGHVLTSPDPVPTRLPCGYCGYLYDIPETMVRRT